MSKETILILDKESHTQWTLKALLESEGYVVHAAGSVERALENFKECEVCSLIAEYRIDESHTPEIVRDLKKEFPELYVMMLTHENLKEEEYNRIISSGIDDFFLKPTSSEKILTHLRKGLSNRKMLLRKKQLEQRLVKIKLSRNVERAAVSKT
jgi:DNA-binding NtrC family response regulator